MTDQSFRCSVCSKTYVRQKAYLNHIRFAHGDDNEFQCKNCNLILTSKARLARHKQSKVCTKKTTKTKQFVCHFCQKVFSKMIELKNHFKLEHKAKLNKKKHKAPSSRVFFESDEDALTCLHKSETDSHQQETIKETWQ